jgi:hypothetical protein
MYPINDFGKSHGPSSLNDANDGCQACRSGDNATPFLIDRRAFAPTLLHD